MKSSRVVQWFRMAETECRLHSQNVQVQILDLLFNICVALGKLFNLLVPQVLQSKEESISAYPKRLFWGLQELLLLLLLSCFSRVRLCVTPPGSSVPGILQARTLEWVAISFSKAWKWKVKVKLLSCLWLFETPWTAAHHVPPSMGFSRQEYWSGVPLPSLIIGTSTY